MAAIYDFGFTATQQAAVGEMMMDYFIQSPGVEQTHNIKTKVVNGEYLAEVGALGLMGKADGGCGMAADTFTGSTASILWATKSWKIKRSECYTGIEDSIKQWGKKQGIDPADMQADDYMNYVVDAFSPAMAEYFWRAAWFTDTTATDYAHAGYITTGIDITYFTWNDGFWKLIRTQVGVDATQRVTLAANAQATYALQESAFSSTDAYNYLDAAYNKATAVRKIRESANPVIMMTRSYADRFDKYLEGKDLPETFSILLDGVRQRSFRGIPIVVCPYWDTTIRTYEDSTAAWRDPHRALLTYRDNLIVGTKADSLFAGIDMFYDKKSEENIFKAMGDIQTSFMYANRFIAIY